MYLTYIVVALATLMVILKGRRKYRRYMRGAIDHKLQLATLAAQTVLGSDIGDTVVDSTWVSSVKATYSIANYTDGAEIGPFICGWADSDYSDAEIEQWVENLQTWDASDKIAQEQSRRQIRQVGTWEETPSDPAITAAINDGKMTTTKLGWLIQTGKTIKFWVYNAGTAAVATTDPEVRVQGHANLWPQ